MGIFAHLTEMPEEKHVGIDDITPLEGHLTKEVVKGLRIGRKVIHDGYVEFGYPGKDGKRVGMVRAMNGTLHEKYFVGWRWRREGFGEKVRIIRDIWSGDCDAEGGFSGTRNVFVLLLKRGPEGDGFLECLPEQCRLKGRK